MDNNKDPFEKEGRQRPETDESFKRGRCDDNGRRDSEGMVPGLLLIGIGVMWILSKFNYVNFSFSNLLRAFVDLWPLILVVAGVNLIFKRQRFVHSITWLIFLGILLFYSVFGPTFFGDKFNMFGSKDSQIVEPFKSSNDVSASASSGKSAGIDSASYPMDKYDPLPETGRASFNLGAGDVFIGSDDDNLVSYVIPNNLLKEKKIEVNGKNAILEFNQKDHVNFTPGQNNSLNFYLNSDIEWDITTNSGAVDGNLDLEDVKVKSLDVNTGAGDVSLILGDKSPMTKVKINGAAADLGLDIPSGSGIRIKVSSMIKDTNFESKGLVKKGDVYETPNYDQADSKIDVEISTAVGDIKLDRH